MQNIEIISALKRLFKLLDGTQHSIHRVQAQRPEHENLSQSNPHFPSIRQVITYKQIPILNGQTLIPSLERFNQAQKLLDDGFIDIEDVDLFLAGDWN